LGRRGERRDRQSRNAGGVILQTQLVCVDEQVRTEDRDRYRYIEKRFLTLLRSHDDLFQTHKQADAVASTLPCRSSGPRPCRDTRRFEWERRFTRGIFVAAG